MCKLIKNPTLFVDIDGTLVKYRKFSEIETSEAEPIQDVVDYINNHYDSGSVIIITTARPEKYKQLTIDELNKVGVKFNKLITDCGRGTRVILNDLDPGNPEIRRAVGINLVRNEGLKNIEIPDDILPYDSE
jgi:hypothetical protein